MQQNKNTPSIRFAGFTDAWEQRKIADECSISTGKSNTQDSVDDGKYPFFVRSPIVERSNRYLFDEEAVLTVGDGVGTGKVFHYVNGKYDLHQRVYRMFDFSENISAKYFYYFFSTHFYDRVMSMTAKTSVDSVRYEMIADMDIQYPNKKEQVAISNFFDNLDTLITLHQRKYDQLVNIKKSMLEKMFPKNGELVPEVRFAGFTDAWEQRKVGDFAKVLSAARVHKHEWTEQGVPFFRSSDVMRVYNGRENEKVYISQELFEELSRVSGRPEKGDIFITGGGSIGMPYIVPNDNPLYSKDADLLWIKKSENHNSQYLYSYFFTPTFRNYIASISHIGTIAHYTIVQVKETPVLLPKIREQEKIGSFFSNLDSLITLHQRKLERLQSIKKACLEKMFV